jgi:hypothetical protein
MVAVLGILHVAPIPLPRGLVLGFLPWDLAFHLAWMLGAACVVVHMTDRVWPHDVHRGERSPADARDRG